MSSLSKWITRVLAGLEEIRWQQVGFEKSKSERGDMKPMYLMENPNELVDSILQQYSTEVYPALSVLLANPSLHRRLESKNPNNNSDPNLNGKYRQG